MKPLVYQRFRRAYAAPAARGTVAVMLLVTVLTTGLGVQRVRSRHEVVRAGYALSQATEEIRHLRETRRQLELERATLANPDRVRALATALGMEPAPPDQIRVVPARPRIANRDVASADR